METSVETPYSMTLKVNGEINIITYSCVSAQCLKGFM